MGDRMIFGLGAPTGSVKAAAFKLMRPRPAPRYVLVAGLAACMAAAGLAGPSFATDVAKGAVAQSPLLITLGSYGVYSPRSEGSKQYRFSPSPIIGWRRESDRQWLDLPRDGIDYTLIETERFRFGPVGAFRFQTDNGSPAARGFRRVGKNSDSIDLSVEAGAFAEYYPVQWLRTRVELRESVIGASGLIGSVSADMIWRPDPTWTVAAGPRITLADSRFMHDYYSVTPAQSTTSGLPVYSASAGVRSVGVGAFAKHLLTSQIAVQGFAEYEHLTGGAGESPVIVTRGTRDQVSVGLGLSYTFRAPW